MVDAQQHHRFDQLCLNDRAAHCDNRLTRENRRTFRNSPHIAGKFEMLEIIEEFLAENMAGAQIFNIVVIKMQVPKIIYQLFHTGHDCESAVIRHFAEKHIEIADRIFISLGKIAVGHRQLIKIGEHGQICFYFVCCHEKMFLSL